MTAVVLFTRDLRVHDHPALRAALADDTLLPLFVLDPRLLGRSPNRDRFLVESLHDLDRSLVKRGGGLVIRRGDPVAETVSSAVEARADSVHVTADGSAYADRRERALGEALGQEGIALRVHPGNAVVEPGEVAPDGKPVYSVFTPFHRAWLQAPRRAVLPAPSRVLPVAGIEPGARPAPVTADSIDLPPGGEAAGRRTMEAYLHDGIERYTDVRDDLAADATSRLSPYLRFGCISANELAALASTRPGGDGLIRQLAWRDFYGALLAHDPSIAWHDYREPPPDVPEAPGSAAYAFECWTLGRTGVPLVDAGMRQLRREGWMHNRARMVTASFLTRRLGVPWQEGAGHFSRWLVDGDPANNSGGWQWVAGTGTDPRRSRSFSPVRQAERFDPVGAYIRRYVRELAHVPTPLLFAPWRDPAVLRETGYPSPVLEVPAPNVRAVPGPGVPRFRAGPPAHPDQVPTQLGLV
jgi:deoxyribodipyrimidine photo-lyase